MALSLTTLVPVGATVSTNFLWLGLRMEQSTAYWVFSLLCQLLWFYSLVMMAVCETLSMPFVVVTPQVSRGGLASIPVFLCLVHCWFWLADLADKPFPRDMLRMDTLTYKAAGLEGSSVLMTTNKRRMSCRLCLTCGCCDCAPHCFDAGVLCSAHTWLTWSLISSCSLKFLAV